MGHAFLIAGRHGMGGCAVLAAQGCLRSGAGKLTVCTQEANHLLLQLALPEAIVHTQPPCGLTPYQAIGVGPGIGTDDNAKACLQELLQQERPMVLDADALTLVAKMGNFPKAGHILTPHPGEMERLANGLQLEGDTLAEQARTLATTYGCHVVLKGHPSLVCCPNGDLYCCPRGNAGMATAGSGDVLTGIITGLWAQGYTAHEATLLGTWLHATAGDYASQHLGQECMLASDIIRHLPQAFSELSNWYHHTEQQESSIKQ